MNNIKESDVQKEITDYLETKGVFYLRLNSGSVFIENRRVKLSPEGTPDLFMLIDGKPIFIELKRSEKVHKTWKNQYQQFLKTSWQTPYNTRSVMQHKQMERITEAGGICISHWSLDGLLEDLKSLGINL